MPYATLSNVASTTYAVFCLLNALPFAGVPFPSRRAVDYYRGKNAWNARLSGGRLTPEQAGYAGAALRVANGLAVLYRPTRLAAHAAVGGLIGVGTLLAWRDARPMVPQWTMLLAIWGCFALEVASRR